MSRRRWVVLLACLSPLVCVGLSNKSIDEFRSPFRPTYPDAARWYDDALGALMYAIVFGACVVHLWRTRQDRSEAVSRPWQAKRELRFVLYSLAALLAAQFPLGIVQAIQASHDPPPDCRTFLCLLPTWFWLGPLIAALIVRYDRRRLRDQWKGSGACHSCGYDLTGNTSGVCPECGTPWRGS